MSASKDKRVAKVILWSMLVACFLELTFAIVMICTDKDVSQIFKVLFIICGAVVVLLSVVSTIIALNYNKKLTLQIEREKAEIAKKPMEEKKEE